MLRIKYRIDFNGGNQWYLNKRDEIKSAVIDLNRWYPQVYEVKETIDESGTVIKSEDIQLKEEELK